MSRVLWVAGAAIVCSALLVPLAAQTAGQAGAEANYKQVCQPCHMADGNAALKPMNFADGEWKHTPTTKELARVIAEGVPGTAMMPFKSRFTEKEMLELAKYVRAFDKSLKPEGGAKAPKQK
jgi:mono/diheme cytochrome c family protein